MSVGISPRNGVAKLLSVPGLVASRVPFPVGPAVAVDLKALPASRWQ